MVRQSEYTEVLITKTIRHIFSGGMAQLYTEPYKSQHDAIRVSFEEVTVVTINLEYISKRKHYSFSTKYLGRSIKL